MSDRAVSLRKTRSPRNSLLAAGILVAIVAVLIGFHGVTMVLSAMSLGASTEVAAKPEAAKPNIVQAAKPDTAKPDSAKSASIQPARDGPKPLPAPLPVESPPPVQPTAAISEPVENPTGMAAAAKAKAQAEMDGALPRDSDARPAASRRQFRATRADKHKVY